jgi:uracil-DNA glycosylase family 4
MCFWTPSWPGSREAVDTAPAMAPPDSIPALSLTGDLLSVIQDLSQYLAHQKKMGITRLDLSSRSFEILASWSQKPAFRMRFKSQGPASAKVLLVDGENLFFAGDAGRLLIKILGAMNLSPESVSICNAPDPARVHHHVRAIRPGVVIALGERAAWTLTGTRTALERIRGQFFDFQGIAVMPTFHPLQLVADPALKRPVWEDMQQVMKRVGLES